MLRTVPVPTTLTRRGPPFREKLCCFRARLPGEAENHYRLLLRVSRDDVRKPGIVVS